MTAQLQTAVSAAMPAAPWRGGRTVLVVVGESAIRELLASQLRAAGCYPMPVASLADGQRLADQVVPDVVVLDLDIAPQAPGWAAQLAGSQPFGGVHLALLGPDPASALVRPSLCLRKPFEPHELVRQLLRLMQPARPARSPLKAGGIEVDRRQPTVRLRLGGRWHSIDLPANEHRLLAFLLVDAGRARSRQEILQAVWPQGAVDLRTVDQCVRRLRQSLARVGAEAVVKTVNGVGYRLQMELLAALEPPR